MTAIGIYVRLGRQATNAFRARLNEIAASHGYIAHSGPTKGQGNLVELLHAIDGGEMALVLLPDEQRARAIEYLETLDAEWATSIANGLRNAIQREAESGWAEIEG